MPNDQARKELADGVAILDDFNAVGDLYESLKVFDHVRERSLHEFGLELRVDKCVVYMPRETQEAATPEQLEAMQAACAERGLRITDRIESLGVMHGSTEDVELFCEEAVNESESFFQALEHPDLPTQHASLLLRYCQVPRLGYLARTVHPDQLEAAAKRFDLRAIRCWQTIHGLTEDDINRIIF
jgi:hypothetical protein